MPFHETDDLVDQVNKEKCLVGFLDLPISYRKSPDFDLIIDYYHVSDLPHDLFEWAFHLVKSNMYTMYDESYTGWNELGKRHEMLEPQTRYLIARSSTDPTDKKGFLSFQMTREETLDDYKMDNTAYCYEIQIEPHAQNQGLGDYLMNLLYQIGCHWKMDKVMLTVFKANQGAFRFYTDKLGFELDPISPSTCLPLYRAKKFDYDLLSKPCQHH